MKNYIAKHRDGVVTYDDHVKANVVLTDSMYKNFILDEELKFFGQDKVKECCILSQCGHDLGKLTKENQECLNTDKKMTIPHNITSWAFLCEYTNLSSDPLFKYAVKNVLYSHMCDIKSDSNGLLDDTSTPSQILESLSKEDIQTIRDKFQESLNIYGEKFNCDFSDVKLVDRPNDSEDTILNTKHYPKMKEANFEELSKFSLFFISKAFTIGCDRLSSQISSSDKEMFEKILNEDSAAVNDILLRKYYKKPININIDDLVNAGYDKERLIKQFEVINEINSNKNNILRASAGDGKTMAALIPALAQDRKVFWIAPTNSIAVGAYDSIIRELKQIGISDKVNVGLYLSGEWKNGKENKEDLDILVTNIDTFCAYSLKHNISDMLAYLLNSFVVFDEYDDYQSHNVISDSHKVVCTPMFSAFISMTFTLSRYARSNVLLMSATADRYDKAFFNTENDNNNLNFNYINANIVDKNVPIKISVIKYNEKDINSAKFPEKDAFVIMNSKISTAQYGYENNGGSYKFVHRGFPVEVSDGILKEMLITNGKKGLKEGKQTCIGTSLIGRGLDVTSSILYDFDATPKNAIQRGCGRLNRFNDESLCGHYCALIPDKKASKKEGMIGQLKQLENSMWSERLLGLSKVNDLTKKQFYKCFLDFREENFDLYLKMDLINFKSSAEELYNLKPYSTKSNYEGPSILSKDRQSFRGVNNNIYVVAFSKNGSICEPIQFDVETVKNHEYNISKNDDVKIKEIRKKQRNYFEECFKKIGKKIKYFEKKKKITKGDSTNRLDEWKFDAARCYDTPLLLTKEEAIYDENCGLVFIQSK